MMVVYMNPSPKNEELHVLKGKNDLPNNFQEVLYFNHCKNKTIYLQLGYLYF